MKVLVAGLAGSSLGTEKVKFSASLYSHVVYRCNTAPTVDCFYWRKVEIPYFLKNVVITYQDVIFDDPETVCNITLHTVSK